MLNITPINEFSQLNLTIRLAKMETDIMVLFAKKKLSDDISVINAFDCEVIDLELELMQLGFGFSACSSKNWLIIENMAKYIPNAISAFKSGQERSIDMQEVSICYECQQNDGLPCSHHG